MHGAFWGEFDSARVQFGSSALILAKAVEHHRTHRSDFWVARRQFAVKGGGRPLCKSCDGWVNADGMNARVKVEGQRERLAHRPLRKSPEIQQNPVGIQGLGAEHLSPGIR